MGMDQAMDEDGRPLEQPGWATNYLLEPQSQELLPESLVRLDTHLAKLDDLIRKARHLSMENEGAVVVIPITAFGKDLATVKVQVPPGTDPRNAKIWWEQKRGGLGCFR